MTNRDFQRIKLGTKIVIQKMVGLQQVYLNLIENTPSEKSDELKFLNAGLYTLNDCLTDFVSRATPNSLERFVVDEAFKGRLLEDMFKREEATHGIKTIAIPDSESNDFKFYLLKPDTLDIDESKEVTGVEFEEISKEKYLKSFKKVTFIDFVNWINSDIGEIEDIKGFELYKDGNEEVFKRLYLDKYESIAVEDYFQNERSVIGTMIFCVGEQLYNYVLISDLRSSLNPKRLLNEVVNGMRKPEDLIGLEIRKEDYPEVFNGLCCIGDEIVLTINGFGVKGYVIIGVPLENKWQLPTTRLLEWMNN